MSFFLLRSNVFDRCRSSGKNVSSLFRLLIQNKHITLSLSPPYIQSNGNLFSMKIEQSSVLIHNANHQIYNVPYNDRKVNDLCWSFRYLISWWHIRRKFMYRVHGLIIAVCARDHIAIQMNLLLTIFIDTSNLLDKRIWSHSSLYCYWHE